MRALLSKKYAHFDMKHIYAITENNSIRDGNAQTEFISWFFKSYFKNVFLTLSRLDGGTDG